MGFWDWFTGGDDKAKADVVSAPPPGPPSPQQIADSLVRIDEMAAQARVPVPVLSRVHRVTKRLREILPRMRNAGLDSADEYSMIATATSYLPESLETYIRLPRDWADTRPIEGGKTSLLLLVDQLDLLGATVDKMYDAVLQNDANALITHGRFLQQKFGGEAPTAPPAPPVRQTAPSTNILDL
ncbi:MAG TPA: hypothetical protein PKM36_08960 [Propionibacteriaceae bacterium]|nr:hypothetical protein [Propionibacteriaceae bacterium]HPZ50067.1 hypothetical protein [Propionibacteriaceae bacterium]HQE30796.1 hypothetical protein [Propionibacteriaceae bacterium]